MVKELVNGARVLASTQIYIYVSTLFTTNFIYYRGWQEVTGENFKVA